jgi:hypothetical protein
MEEILKVLNYQPVDIYEDDLKNPLTAIGYFFENHPLHKSREKLWKLYKGWVHLSAESADGDETKDMLFFYNQLVEVLNLCYVLTQIDKTPQK